ncbi:MAG: class I SAM-dependent methyltransferase [Patescibacteria group bacterium]|nr:class I SAM-dependent methyltransferase [Patescibacteria group bacterium]
MILKTGDIPYIDLYDKTPGSYDRLQHMRPDYVGAQQAFVDMAVKYLGGKKDVSLADFCSGTGKDTRLVSDRVEVASARLIDINKDFLEQALEQGIKAKNITVEQSDILAADVGTGADAVISMFAYHHVKDADKSVPISRRPRTPSSPAVSSFWARYTARTRRRPSTITSISSAPFPKPTPIRLCRHSCARRPQARISNTKSPASSPTTNSPRPASSSSSRRRSGPPTALFRRMWGRLWRCGG